MLWKFVLKVVALMPTVMLLVISIVLMKDEVKINLRELKFRINNREDFSTALLLMVLSILGIISIILL